jgi:hypothetical protein
LRLWALRGIVEEHANSPSVPPSSRFSSKSCPESAIASMKRHEFVQVKNLKNLKDQHEITGGLRVEH